MARAEFHPDAAAVQLDNALCDGEAKPGSALSAGIGALGLLELLEDALLITFRNSWAGVGDRNQELALARGGLHSNFARLRELDRIGGQIEQHLHNAALVGLAARQVGLNVRLNDELFLQHQRFERGESGQYHLLHRIVGKRKQERPGLDLG